MRPGSPGGVAPWVQTHWDWRAAGNFIGGGSGTGLLIALALSGAAAARGVALLGLACVLAGLLCVWAEIGRPWRALNVFRHAATSWMTREALLAPVLIGCGLAAALSGAAAWYGAAAACAAAYLYCQARMLRAARGIPAWRQPRIVPLVLATGMAEGSGLLAACGGIAAVTPARAGTLLLLACTARAVAWIAYRQGVHRDGAPHAALGVLDRMHWPLLWVDALAGTAALVGAASGALGLLALAGAAALATGWWLKYMLVRRAAVNQGFALVLAPERGVGGHGPPARPGWSHKPGTRS
ncbi:MAG: phenylacetyl-CoA:acceptor oxidoreductase [Gammaproteobacteria bacterium]|nr:phenylacetyl-CoA:acceptor oxidoreductase [Gammaproteobacteria bacterium]